MDLLQAGRGSVKQMSKLAFIFVHGLSGWGAYDRRYQRMPYWGMRGGDLMACLRQQRHLSRRAPPASCHRVHRADTRQPVDTGIGSPLVHPALRTTDHQPLGQGSHCSRRGLGVDASQHRARHGVWLQHGSRCPLQPEKCPLPYGRIGWIRKI